MAFLLAAKVFNFGLFRWRHRQITSSRFFNKIHQDQRYFCIALEFFQIKKIFYHRAHSLEGGFADSFI